jgi:hypothetical protein
MLITTELKKTRGWTDTHIQTFLPEPDETRKNPRNRKGAPMRLYSLARVEAIEATQEFQAAREASRTRQLAARSRSLEKKQEAVAVAKAIELRLVADPYGVMREKSVAHFNGRLRRNQTPMKIASQSKAMDRACVNYLRHRMSSYEAELKQFKGVVGVGEAYLIIRNRVLDLIAAEYPALAAEAERQKFEAPELPDDVVL